MDIGSRIGSGNLTSRLRYKQRIDSIGTFVNEMANRSTEKALLDLIDRFGENTREVVKGITGGRFISTLGQNIKMR